MAKPAVWNFLATLFLLCLISSFNQAVAAAPSAPSSINVSSTITGPQKYPTASVSWNLGADGGASITNHQWSIDGTNWSNFSEGLVTNSPGTISQSSRLNFGTSYIIRVRAVNSSGNGTSASATPITFSPASCSPNVSADGKSFIFTKAGVCEWTLPQEVKSTVNFDLRGAQGGGSFELKGSAAGEGGGLGARMRGAIDLTSFNSIYVFVGSKGMENTKAARPLGTNFGGFNGGGDGKGGTYSNSSYTTAGGGGGATDIRTSLDAISSGSDSRLLVAGGGGGSSRTGNGGNSGRGGPGGPSTQTTAYIASGTKGQDGTYSGDWIGGAGGATSNSCSLYGIGATSSRTDAPQGFGAGGGGFCGGGVGSDNNQGWGAPGGGGSSFANSVYVATQPIHNGGAQCGDGSLVISVSGFNAAQVPAPDTTNCGGKDPVAPTLSGTKLNGRVSLTWTDSNVDVSDYVIEYSTSSTFASAVTIFADGESNAKSATVNGLTNGTSYYFRVRAINDYGISAYSEKTSAIVPNLPSTPATPVLSSGSDLGTSNDNSTADDSPTFQINSGLTSGADVTLTATIASGATSTCTFRATGSSGSCEFSSLGNGTYSIKATQSIGGDSSADSSSLANVVINKLNLNTPGIPDLIAASDTGMANDDNITKNKTPIISSLDSFSGTATVTASKAGSTDVPCDIASTASPRQCQLGNLAADGVWSVTVTYKDSFGNVSSPSDPLLITIDTVAPTKPSIATQSVTNNMTIPVQSSEIGIAYLAANTSLMDAYLTDINGNFWNSTPITVANTPADFSTSGLSNQVYSYYVTDVAGNISARSDNYVTIATAASPSVSGPTRPTSSSPADEVGSTLTNVMSVSGVPTPVITYQYVRCPSTSDDWVPTCVNIPGATSTTYTLTAEDAGQHIGIRVTATNSQGTTVQLGVATAKVTAAVPSAPTSVSATITGSTTASVAFTAPASNGGAAITDYDLEYSSNSGSTWTSFNNGTSTANPILVTGLTANTSYIFRVKAKNSAGDGSFSVASSVQTTHAAPTIASTLGTATFPRLSNDVFEEFEGPGPSTGITVTVNGVTTPISTDPATGNVSIALKASSWTNTATYGSLSGYMLNFYNSIEAPIITFPSGVSQFRFLVAGLAVQPTILLTYTNGSTSDTLTLNTGGGEGAPYVITITAPSGKFINSFRITPPSQDWWHLDNISYVAALSTTTSVSSKSLTAGTAATSFTPITASGGGSSKTYSISPSLPSGLSLNTSTGAITGTPTGATASMSYTVTVIAGASTSSASFTLGVNAALSSSAGTVPSGVYKDVAVTAFTPVSFSGGTSPVTYSVSPSLPAGLSLNASTGVISGTATGTAPSTTYTVTATDANGDSEASTFAFAVTNQPTAPGAPTIGAATSTGQTTATVAFTAPANTGGAAITTYTVTASPGSITATGSSSPITVTGLTAGTAYTFSITATNAAGLTSSSSSPSSSITTESAPVQNNNNGGGGGGGGGAPAPAPEPAPEPVCNAACVAAQNAAAKAAADKAAAEKAAAEKLVADKAAAVAVAEKTKVDVSAAVAAATAAAEKVSAATVAKAAADTIAAAVSTVVNSANAAQTSTSKITSEAAASIKSAPAAATKAASTASANSKANTAANQVKAAAAAAQKAAASSQAQTSDTPEIAFGSSNTASAASQAAAKADAAARAGKAAANEVAAAAEAKSIESRATATALQNEANAAVAEVIAEQKVASALATEAKVAADKASAATTEKIAATAAAKTAAETLVTLLSEKVAIAEKVATAASEEVRVEAQKSLDAVNIKIAEAERAVTETVSKADAAIVAQAEAIKVAEAAKATAEEQVTKVDQLLASVPTKATAAVRAASAAAVAAKVATAAKAAAAKIPSRAVISAKPGVSTGKNSTRATISGLKPGQKVKVTVNVKPKP